MSSKPLDRYTKRLVRYFNLIQVKWKIIYFVKKIETRILNIYNSFFFFHVVCQVSIWDYYNSRKHVLMNGLDITLDDANIQMDQDVSYIFTDINYITCFTWFDYFWIQILVEAIDTGGVCRNDVEENRFAKNKSTGLAEPFKTNYAVFSANKGVPKKQQLWIATT